MMDLLIKIEEIANPLIEPIGAYIIDILISPNEKQKIIQLFVDTDAGITIEQCAEINRKLGQSLEILDIIQESFIVQVSSPGLEKPLKLLRQYNKNIGRQFKVRFYDGDEIVEKLAILSAIGGNTLIFTDKKNETYRVMFEKIIESIEELPW